MTKIYDQIKSGNFDEGWGEIRKKLGKFISHSEWEPCIIIHLSSIFIKKKLRHMHIQW